MKINNQKLVNRWNNLMNDLCLEYLTINTRYSELETHKQYYNIEEGISIVWMLKEAKYTLSCYYEEGHCRCDDRFEGKAEYKTWVSETGKLKRLIATLEKMENTLVVEWIEEAEHTEATTQTEITTEYKEVTEAEAKESYCNGLQIYVSTDKREFVKVPCSGDYGSHAPAEQLFYRSIPKGEGNNRYFVKCKEGR